MITVIRQHLYSLQDHLEKCFIKLAFHHQMETVPLILISYLLRSERIAKILRLIQPKSMWKKKYEVTGHSRGRLSSIVGGKSDQQKYYHLCYWLCCKEMLAETSMCDLQ